MDEIVTRPDRQSTEEFRRALDPEASGFTFQRFPDRKENRDRCELLARADSYHIGQYARRRRR